ncbi:unnamed protein product [Adineta ricciae]|uniref:PhoD-like phosphatase domain-containing protein n=1 Tax=Adineta ricciae TaxID=249248 RepID=A0A813SCQ5_ADIRI|nr:unnamed protein product [Adineta ricciae]CAF1526502.1 unnamed protein product [Adineta ricciae]
MADDEHGAYEMATPTGKYRNLNANDPNPVNPNPQSNTDCPPPRQHTTKIKAMPLPSNTNAKTPSISRPPRKPGPALGPYYHFISTDLNRMLWLGSALIFREISYDRPQIEFTSEAKLDFNWEILYDNIFNMRAYRVNISIELRHGDGDDRIGWKIDWSDRITEGAFHIARYNQKWRGGFFSCNGFDATVSEQAKSHLIFENVWEHLNSIHGQVSLHLLIWGGDQTYIDFIFEDIPFLKDWVDMEWNAKWTCDFRDDLREQVEEYHFNTYVENWERPEVKNALASIPSLMMWDDHDIFDGAGSYPPLLHDSPMMTGLFKTAQRMRLLFQHHTTVEKARDHGLFGYQGYNFLTLCGPNLAILGADARTERTAEVVQDELTWNMIFDRLDKQIQNIPHLIILFPVPFSFLRLKVAETCFEHIKNLPNKCRQLPLVKQTNSIFGLPELYDDLLDEWTHDAHIDERNRALRRFQELAQKKRVRITFFSGDVHCCGISRFKTHSKTNPPSIYDPKLMYQVISSAIVNLPPPRTAIHIAHLVKTTWYPIENTKEELVDFFQCQPETGKRILHRKILPNRNWCYFEQCDDIDPVIYTTTETGCFRRCFASKNRTTPEAGPISRSAESLARADIGQVHSATQTLKVRLWIESGRKHRPGREFVHYDLLIPNLI